MARKSSKFLVKWLERQPAPLPHVDAASKVWGQFGKSRLTRGRPRVGTVSIGHPQKHRTRAAIQPAPPPFRHRGRWALPALPRTRSCSCSTKVTTGSERIRQPKKRADRLAGLTIINAFFENSTRTLLLRDRRQRLGADVVNMAVAQSSVKKGETLIDTAMTLNAMHADAPSSSATAVRARAADRGQGGLPGAQCRRWPARDPPPRRCSTRRPSATPCCCAAAARSAG